MEIRLTDSNGRLFAQVATWEDANAAIRAVFKRQRWSDIHYFIEFDSKQEAYGSIDIEPRSFHTHHQREIFTKHLKTVWGNLANLNPQKSKIYGVSAEDKRFFRYLLTELPEHTTPIN